MAVVEGAMNDATLSQATHQTGRGGILDIPCHLMICLFIISIFASLEALGIVVGIMERFERIIGRVMQRHRNEDANHDAGDGFAD
jgi:hypothetical protein